MRLADEPAGQGSDQPRRQGRLAARLRRGLPVVTGALLMLLAVLLYGVLSPGTPPLSKTDVQTTIADALASVTPAPAFSERVYQAVRPSLVLIETTGNDDDGPRGEHDGLGSGVVVSLAGDILTSLHVVADATEVHVTFADGTRVDRRGRRHPARERHRGRPRRRPARGCRAGRPGRPRVGP